jgi:ribosomal-protein-alanine N-acetyltransferase
VLYRLYSSEDFAALYAIEEVCFQPPQRFSRSYMRRLVRQPDSVTWIAEQDGRLCGFGLVEWTREGDETVAYIQTLEVLPEVRGQGVGGELLQRMETSACVAGAVAIWLHVDAGNAAAIRVYERHGYNLTGREEDYYGSGKPGLVHAKPLRAEQGG